MLILEKKNLLVKLARAARMAGISVRMSVGWIQTAHSLLSKVGMFGQEMNKYGACSEPRLAAKQKHELLVWLKSAIYSDILQRLCKAPQPTPSLRSWLAAE